MANRNIPGVNFRETEIEQIIEGSPTGIPAGVIGTAELGPAFVPVVVGEFEDWTKRFGRSENRAGALASSAWLRRRNSLMFMRVLGVGDGERRSEFVVDDETYKGNVLEAGLALGKDRTVLPSFVEENTFAESNEGVQIPGRINFIGAWHKDKDGKTLLKESGIDTSISASPVVRGVLMTPNGVAATMLSTSSFGDEALEGVALDPQDTASYGTDPTDLLGGAPIGYLSKNSNGSITSRIFLNGHIATPENPNEYEISFDPRSSVYIAKALNTDPTKIKEKGHCLYSWWDIDPTEVEVTGFGAFPEEALTGERTTLQLGAFIFFGGHTVDAFDQDNFTNPKVVNYENFEERYTEPLSPWILSEDLGMGVRKKLFRIHSLDSGEKANTLFKLGINNIRRKAGEWTQFDLEVRSWNDTDTNPVVLELFANVNLNPESPDYILRKIGDRRIYYVWDSNEENQGLEISGSYPIRSRYIWCEVSEEVEAGLSVYDCVPIAHEGLPHITVHGADSGEAYLWYDELLAGDDAPIELAGPEQRLQGVGAVTFNTTGFLDYDGLPVEAQRIIVRVDVLGAGGVSDSATLDFAASAGAPAIIDTTAILDDLTSAININTNFVDINVTGDYITALNELTFTHDDDNAIIVTLQFANRLSTSVFKDSAFSKIRQAPVPFRKNVVGKKGNKAKANSRYNWGFKWNIPFVSNDSSLQNWSKFFPDLGVTPFWSKVAGVPVGTFGETRDVNLYNNNLFSLEKIAIVEDSSGRPNQKKWNEAFYVRDLDATEFDVGERFVVASDLENPLARRWLKFTVPVFGGWDGVNILDPERKNLTDFAVYTEKEEKEMETGPTWTAWKRAVESVTDENDIDVQLLAIPGIRHRSVTDEAMRLVENRLDAVYIADVELWGEDKSEFPVYLKDIRDISVGITSSKWLERDIDNTFVSAYMPDVFMPDPQSGRVSVAPASSAVLGAFGLNDALGFVWTAAAGASRGVLETVESLPLSFTPGELESLYSISINPIITLTGSGPVVWGSKTTRRTESILNRVNVRRLLIDIRRKVSEVSKGFLFEQNVPETLARFQSLVLPIITDIKNKRGVKNAVVFIDASTTTELDIQNGVIKGIIGVQPTNSYEFATIDFRVNNSVE